MTFDLWKPWKFFKLAKDRDQAYFEYYDLREKEAIRLQTTGLD